MESTLIDFQCCINYPIHIFLCENPIRIGFTYFSQPNKIERSLRNEQISIFSQKYYKKPYDMI